MSTSSSSDGCCVAKIPHHIAATTWCSLDCSSRQVLRRNSVTILLLSSSTRPTLSSAIVSLCRHTCMLFVFCYQRNHLLSFVVTSSNVISSRLTTKWRFSRSRSRFIWLPKQSSATDDTHFRMSIFLTKNPRLRKFSDSHLFHFRFRITVKQDCLSMWMCVYA